MAVCTQGRPTHAISSVVYNTKDKSEQSPSIRSHAVPKTKLHALRETIVRGTTHDACTRTTTAQTRRLLWRVATNKTSVPISRPWAKTRTMTCGSSQRVASPTHGKPIAAKQPKHIWTPNSASLDLFFAA